MLIRLLPIVTIKDCRIYKKVKLFRFLIMQKNKKLYYPNLINKAKRQTIEAFLGKGEWKIALIEDMP